MEKNGAANNLEPEVVLKKVVSPKMVRWGQTINLNFGCLGMGLMSAVIGATLIDLTEVYDTSTEKVSHLITCRGFGALCGSLFGGYLLDRYNTQVLISLATLIGGITIACVPLCGDLKIAYAVIFIYGLTVGTFDTGANVCIVHLWGKNNGPMLQFYHFAFGIGGLVAPIIAEPFLSLSHHMIEELGAEAAVNLSRIAIPSSFIDRNLSLRLMNENGINETSLDEFFDEPLAASRPSRIEYPYAMIGGFHIILFFLMAAMYLVDNSDTKPPKIKKPVLDDEDARIGRFQRLFQMKYLLLLFLSCYLCVYVGLESCLGQMLSSFAVKSKLKFTKSQASYLASLFWSTFTLSRVASAYWALKSTPLCMITTEHIMAVSAFMLFVFYGESSVIMAWVCTALVGIGSAGMFATAVTWAVQHMRMTNRMMSVSTIFSGAGGMMPPFIVGRFIDDNPMILMHACAVISLVLTGIAICMYFTTRKMPIVMARKKKPKKIAETTEKPEKLMTAVV